MQFKTEGADSSGVTMRASQGFSLIGRLLYVLAIIALPPGILLLLTDSTAPTTAHALIGFGLFFWGASNAARRAQESLPSTLIFDNTLRVLRIFQKTRGRETEDAQIAYSQIQRFGKVHRYDEGAAVWHTTVDFRDGSFWTLSAWRSADAARADADKLNFDVHLQSSGDKAALPPLPTGIRETGAGQRRTYTWQLGFFFWDNLRSYVAVAGFVWAMFSFVDASDLAGKIAVGAFTCVTCIAAVYIAVRWIGASGILDFDGTNVNYSEQRRSKKHIRHTISIASIDQILFHADTENVRGAILLLTTEQNKHFQKINNGDIEVSEVIASLKFLRGIFKVYTPRLSFCEKLAFTEHIRNTVATLLPGRNI